MVAVEKARSQKAAAENQIRSAFLRVKAHQSKRTRSECQHRGHGLEQRMKLGIAVPGNLADAESADKQNNG